MDFASVVPREYAKETTIALSPNHYPTGNTITAKIVKHVQVGRERRSQATIIRITDTPNKTDIGKEFFAKFFDPAYYIPEGEYPNNPNEYMKFQTNNEVIAYERLKDLQGITVPRFIGRYLYGKNEHEHVDVILLEKIDAPCCATLKGLSSTETALIREVGESLIGKFHLRGVVHNDIVARNMFWDRHNERLIICDFSAAVMLDDGNLTPNERIRLKRRDFAFMGFALDEMEESRDKGNLPVEKEWMNNFR